MVRTKADSCSRKAVAAKAPRKLSTPTRTSTASDKAQGAKKSGAGGNSCMSRPVPDWQKPISMFFSTKTTSSEEQTGAEQKSNKERSTKDKENDSPNVNDDELVELPLSDSEETIQTSKKVLNKRRQEDFMDSDDDDDD